jgi:hypothetical protein
MRECNAGDILVFILYVMRKDQCEVTINGRFVLVQKKATEEGFDLRSIYKDTEEIIETLSFLSEDNFYNHVQTNYILKDENPSR